MERPFTVDEYHTLARAGILDEDSRTELIDGRIIVMSPIGSRHLHTVNQVLDVFAEKVYALSPRPARLSVQNPIRLSTLTEPEPDLVLLRPDAPQDRTPTPADALLVVEVVDSSAAYDRQQKAPHYAAASVPELWIVPLAEDAVEVYRRPGPEGYAEVQRHNLDAELSVETVPQLSPILTRSLFPH